MPFLPIITSKQLIKLLKTIGFAEIRQKGSHLTFYRENDNISITIPIHSKTIGIGLTHTIIKQAGLTPKKAKKLLKKINFIHIFPLLTSRERERV